MSSPFESRIEHDRKNRIAVVGLGIGGLTTALKLQDNGIQSDLFEAGYRVGGRMQTARLGERTGELGGEHINTEHKALRSLGKRVNRILGETRVQFIDLSKTGKESGRIDYVGSSGKIYAEDELSREFGEDVWPQLKEHVRKSGGSLDLNVQNAKHAPQFLRALDNMPLAEYIDDLHTSPAMTDVLHTTFQGLNHLPTTHQSSLNGAQLLATSDRDEFNPFGDTDDGRFLLKGGNDTLTGGLREAIEARGGDIRLGHRLVKIKANPDRSYTLTFDEEGKRVEKTYDQIVLNIPLKVLAQTVNLKESGLSQQRIDAIQNTAYGQGGKVLYETRGAAWNGLGSDGLVVMGGERAPSMVWNTWQPGNRGGILTHFISDQPHVGKDREDAYFQKVADQIEIELPGMSKHWTGRAARSDWQGNRLAMGTYPTPTPGYYQQHFGSLEVKPSETDDDRGIHFVGDYANMLGDGSYGYMNDGVVSGTRVASEIAELLKGKKRVS